MERWFYSGSKDPVSRYMSNFQRTPSDLVPSDGNRYGSVEALFQAQKFDYLVGGPRPDLKEPFTSTGSLGSASHYSGLAIKRASGKATFKRLGLVLDVERWNAASGRIMRDALTLRWHNDPKLRRVVAECLAAGEVLLHFQRGQHYRTKSGVVFGRDPLRIGETLTELSRAGEP